MTICSHCGKRKAKRSCPALRDRICQLCCGTLRGKKVSCPEDCDHFRKHTPYQESKKSETESSRESDIVLRDERLMWLAVHIEAALDQLASHDPSFSDDTAIQALEWALDETAKERRLILLPDEFERPVDPAGQALLKAAEACRFSKSVLLETESEGYSREHKILCLKFLLQNARRLSKDKTGGRAFLDLISARLARLKSPRG